MNENPYTDKDQPRLSKQRADIRDLMIDGEFRTLREIAEITGYPEASISAVLRALTEPENGGYVKNRIHKGEGKGTWYYQILENGFLFSTRSKSAGELIKTTR
jgi:DNA-binding transcriptional regulator GbsR (MarR family)